MADADKTLKLLIELGVVGKEDAQAAQDLLDKQKKSVKDLANEELTASREIIAAKKQERDVLEQLKNLREEAKTAGRDTAEFDDAIKRMNASLSEGGHHLNSGRQSAMLFRQALMSVGGYVPGLEYAVYGLGTAMGTVTAGVIGGAVAISTLIKKYEEWQANLDAIAEAARNSDFLNNILAQNQALGDAAANAQSLADAESNLINHEQTLGEKLRAQLSLWQAIERARAGLTSAQKELALANMQQQENAGQLSPVAAAAAKSAIEQFYANKAQRDHEQSQNSELNAKRTALDAAYFNQADFDRRADAAARALAESKAHQGNVNLDPAEQQKKIAEQQAKLFEMAQRLEWMQGGAPTSISEAVQDPLRRGSPRDEIERFKNEMEIERGKLNQFRQQLAQYQETQTPEAKEATKQLEDEATQRAEAAKQNAQTIQDLTKQISELNDTIKATRYIERSTVTTKQETSDLKSESDVSHAVAKDVRTINDAARTVNPSSEVRDAALKALRDIEFGMQNYNAAVVTELGKLHASIADLTLKVRNLQGGQ